MKNALKRLQGRARNAWHLAQARTAIARCERSLARRGRIGVPLKRRPSAPFFAPGIIDLPPRPRRTGLRPYVFTVAVALLSAAFYLVRGGLWS